LAADYRSSMGQFLTPPKVATLLARTFEPAGGDVRLLDLGAGVGALAAAFVEEVLRREPGALPPNIHGLAANIIDLAERFPIPLDDVWSTLDAATTAGRGAKLLNVCPCSSILDSA